jgi:hypothetical protein
MTVTAAAERLGLWDTTSTATMEGLVASVDISIPISPVTQYAP